MKKLVIIGAGGHSKVVLDIALACGEDVLGFLDDNLIGNVCGYPILGKIANAFDLNEQCKFVIAIGDNNTRKFLSEKYKLNWCVLIHPNAIVSASANIEEGSVVMPGAIINSTSKIGKHCIINSGAIVEHDNFIDNYCHISPHATVCGTVKIGELTHIGAGAVIRNNITITSNCIIGAGAVLLKDATKSGIYVGVPARMVEK